MNNPAYRTRPFDWLQAYKDGYRAGHLDRQIGVRSEYSFVSFATEPEYVQEYSRGYQMGILGLAMRP